MRSFLFVIQLEHVGGMGQSASGTVQRSEHIINALTQLGTCDILVVKSRPYQQGDIETLAGWLGTRGEVFVADGSKESSPIVHRMIRRVLRMIGCSVLEQNYVPNKTCSAVLQKRMQNAQYDLIVCRYLRSAITSGALRQKNTGVVIDLDDDPLEIARVQSKGRVGFSYKFSEWIIQRAMQSALMRCSHVWVIKLSDAENYPNCPVSILPNIPVLPETAVCDLNANGYQVLFIGMLGWLPNLEGITHFIKSVWPSVIAERTDAVLRVVGGGASEELRQLMEETAGVEYMGWQESLRPAYESASVCICPVYEGGGSKIKILEALAHKRPAVITEQAYDGVKDDLERGAHLLVAYDDIDFSRKILRTLNDHGEARRLADNGYEVIAAKFSESTFYTQVAEDVSLIHTINDKS